MSTGRERSNLRHMTNDNKKCISPNDLLDFVCQKCVHRPNICQNFLFTSSHTIHSVVHNSHFKLILLVDRIMNDTSANNYSIVTWTWTRVSDGKTRLAVVGWRYAECRDRTHSVRCGDNDCHFSMAQFYSTNIHWVDTSTSSSSSSSSTIAFAAQMLKFNNERGV